MCAKSCVSCRACGGNIKLGEGNVLSFSKIYGSDPVYIKRLDMAVTGTCGGHCEGCKTACYVRKSYRYESVKFRHAVNTIAFRTDLVKAFAELESQLSHKRNLPAWYRINQSGELETVEEFAAWCAMAVKFPTVNFWLYTKAYEIVIPALLAGIVPQNLTVLISVWHEHGIREYAKVAHLPNVKVFAYDDHAYNYAENGMQIQTYCRAYDENGKLNHDITCTKCRKCMDRNSSHKIIGCLAH